MAAQEVTTFIGGSHDGEIVVGPPPSCECCGEQANVAIAPGGQVYLLIREADGSLSAVHEPLWRSDGP